MSGGRESLLDEARPPEGLSLRELVRELAGRATLSGDGDVRIFGVHHDSRRVTLGDLFVARKGARFDGRKFVEAALANGAVALLVPEDLALAEAHANVPVIRVDDVARGLAVSAAAVYGHPSFSLDVVGITGTNGKTTTTHLVRAAIDGALSGAFCGTIGTVGHSYAGRTIPAEHTTPEADELARVMAVMKKRGATHVAAEVSSIAISLGRVLAVRFRVAAFTNLTQDHLDFHGSMDAYAAAKAELFTTLAPGMAVINVDDPFGAELARQARCQVVRVRTRAGSTVDADVAVTSVTKDASGMQIVARTPDGEVTLSTRLVGAHNVENLLVALGVVVALELDVDRAVAALAVEPGAPGRLERCDGADDDILVVVDYAHTPDALARVLDALREWSFGDDSTATTGRAGASDRRLWCVFGCGGDRDHGKRRPMGEAVGSRVGVAILTNDNPRTEDPVAIAAAAREGLVATGLVERTRGDLATGARGWVCELDRSKAIELAVLGARPGDVVLVAGKGHEDYQIVGEVRSPFDDRVHARAALARRRGGARVDAGPQA